MKYYVIIKLGSITGCGTLQTFGPFDDMNDAWVYGDLDPDSCGLGKNSAWVVIPIGVVSDEAAALIDERRTADIAKIDAERAEQGLVPIDRSPARSGS